MSKTQADQDTKMAVVNSMPGNDHSTKGEPNQLSKTLQEKVSNLSRENKELRSDIHGILDSFAEQSKEMKTVRAQERSNNIRMLVLKEELKHFKDQAKLLLLKNKLLLKEKHSKSKGRCQEQQPTLGSSRNLRAVFGSDKHKLVPRCNSTVAPTFSTPDSDLVASGDLKTRSEISSKSSVVADTAGDTDRVMDEDLNARWGTCSLSSTESSDYNPAKDGCVDGSTNNFIPVEIQKLESQVLCPRNDVVLLETW
jgi:hypothetical protein